MKINFLFTDFRLLSSFRGTNWDHKPRQHRVYLSSVERRESLMKEFDVLRSWVQKFPAWHTKAAPNGKTLWGIYSAIYGEVNVSVEKCVEIKGDYVEK